eukprot:CFRG8450T1
MNIIVSNPEVNLSNLTNGKMELGNFPDGFKCHVVSKSPRMAEIVNLLTKEEADSIIALAHPKLKASRVVGDGVNAYVRTSTSCKISRTHPDVMKVLKRLSAITGYDVDHFETIQVVHYDKSQQYMAHNDWFNPNNDKLTYKKHISRGGQRLITVFCYLSNVEGGGETEFPILGKSFSPQCGHALLWYNRKRKGEEGGACMDHRVLHAGKPVTSGEKWGMNVWIRERKYLST